MDSNVQPEEKLLYKNEVFQIVGCAIEVLNTLGHARGTAECVREQAADPPFAARSIGCSVFPSAFQFNIPLTSILSLKERRISDISEMN